METRTISFRVPWTAASLLEQSAARANVSVARAVDWLLRNSVSNFQLLRDLADWPDICDVKVDARIPVTTLQSSRSVSAQLGISLSVYIRTLMYHFYITKNLRYVESDGHYTLAYRHD
jgi:hypothetical protein